MPEREKFHRLLTDLFQFDSADLDFGIYRIMNHKRDVLRRFIDESLPSKVESALNEGPLAAQTQAQARLTEAERLVHETIGDKALNADGSLNDQVVTEDVRKLPVVAGAIDRYLAAKRDADNAIGSSRGGAAARIYNHLYAFFSRYYQDGDFISKRRYSRNNRYAIPYNGEEVYLHWANSDQYYVKSEEHFYNYDWKAPNGVDVRFRLDNADIERNNVKGDKRFFLPLADKTEWDAAARVVSIPFEYRPLNAREKTAYKKRNTQDDINARALTDIPQALAHQPDAAAALTAERTRDNGGEPVSHFQHHLRRYVARNNADFFIHKDLRGFLNRELDFYLKNEVLNLDDLAVAGLGVGEAEFQIMRLVKSVGGAIIDFLAQIEDFQKMLWEKRKFVAATNYCIALNRIDPRFYPEIAANAAQWQEWHKLGFLVNILPPPQDQQFLTNNPTLPLDTRHFDRDFTDRLLASFDDLDGLTDGVLAHGDNWQALRLMQEKYRNQVQCVYIDPPYNSKSTEIIYKNEYKHSSWMSLMENRLVGTIPLMSESAVLSVAIDENEQERLGLMLSGLFPTHDKTCVSVVHNPGGIQGDNFSYNNEFAYFIYPPGKRSVGMQNRDDNPDIRPLRDVSTGQHLRNDAANCFYPIYIKAGNVIGFGEVCEDAFHPESVNMTLDDGVIAVYPIDAQGNERKWVFSRRRVEEIANELTAEWNKPRKIWDIIRRKTIFNYKTVWDSKRYNSNAYGSKLLADMIGKGEFSFPKSINTVADCVQLATATYSDAVVLDYFAGSGTTAHAVINLNREDGGRRKFILVEMGEYFDAVLLPRVKKAVFAPEWRDGKPKRAATPEEAERSPRVIKYITLESYEDALDSIQFDVDASQLPLEEFGDEYLLKYMLFWETKASPVLLNAADLTRPFSYKLRAHINGQKRERPVDLPETFNWLLGLNVSARRVHYDDCRRYLVYQGETRERPDKRVAVIWRETEGWEQADFARDRQFVKEQGFAAGADVVYVNGGSCIPDARAIEPLFKSRMFSAATG